MPDIAAIAKGEPLQIRQVLPERVPTSSVPPYRDDLTRTLRTYDPAQPYHGEAVVGPRLGIVFGDVLRQNSAGQGGVLLEGGGNLERSRPFTPFAPSDAEFAKVKAGIANAPPTKDQVDVTGRADLCCRSTPILRRRPDATDRRREGR